MANNKISAQAEQNAEQHAEQQRLPLSAANYALMAVCGVLIVLGFILMSGSANEGTTFNESIFDTRRVVVGPLVSLAGFVLMAFAIIYRKK